MIGIRLVGVVAAVLCVASGALAADDTTRKVFTPNSDPTMNSNLYIGLGLGQGQMNLTAPLSTNSAVAYDVAIGYQFSRNLAAEIGYVNLGKATATAGSVGGKTAVGSVTGIGSVSVGDVVSLYAKFGLAKAVTKWDSALAPQMSTTQNKTALTGGVGVSVDFAPRVAMRVGYDRYNVGSTDPATGYAQTVLLTVLFKL